MLLVLTRNNLFFCSHLYFPLVLSDGTLRVCVHVYVCVYVCVPSMSSWRGTEVINIHLHLRGSQTGLRWSPGYFMVVWTEKQHTCQFPLRRVFTSCTARVVKQECLYKHILGWCHSNSTCKWLSVDQRLLKEVEQAAVMSSVGFVGGLEVSSAHSWQNTNNTF